MKNELPKSGIVPVAVCEAKSSNSTESQVIFTNTHQHAHTGNLNSGVGPLSFCCQAYYYFAQPII